MAYKVNLLQAELSYVSESCIFQFYDNTKINQDMKISLRLSCSNKNKDLFRKELNNLETRFAEVENGELRS